MIEKELKFLINDAQAISKKISSISFALTTPRTYEKSVMFDNSEKLMQITDGRIRVRTSDNKIEFAYKKPVTREGIKQEIEYEVEVSNEKLLEKILNSMNFFETTSYERYRTEYKSDEIKITLDEYPFASYLEIEGEDEKKLLEIAKNLGLELGNNLTDSCDTLFTKWRISKGLEPKKHMKFDDYER